MFRRWSSRRRGRSPVNTVPLLIGVILHLTVVVSTAIAIARERGNLQPALRTGGE